MRFRSLDLEKFGPFTARTIRFPTIPTSPYNTNEP